MSTILRRDDFLYIESPGMDFWRDQIFHLVNVCNQDVSFPDIPPHTMHIQGILQVKLSYHTRGVLTGLYQK